VLTIRRSKLYYTASGIITPVGGRPVHRLREDLLHQIFRDGRKPVVQFGGKMYEMFSLSLTYQCN